MLSTYLITIGVLCISTPIGCILQNVDKDDLHKCTSEQDIHFVLLAALLRIPIGMLVKLRLCMLSGILFTLGGLCV